MSHEPQFRGSKCPGEGCFYPLVFAAAAKLPGGLVQATDVIFLYISYHATHRKWTPHLPPFAAICHSLGFGCVCGSCPCPSCSCCCCCCRCCQVLVLVLFVLFIPLVPFDLLVVLVAVVADAVAVAAAVAAVVAAAACGVCVGVGVVVVVVIVVVVVVVVGVVVYDFVLRLYMVAEDRC